MATTLGSLTSQTYKSIVSGLNLVRSALPAASGTRSRCYSASSNQEQEQSPEDEFTLSLLDGDREGRSRNLEIMIDSLHFLFLLFPFIRSLINT